MTTNTQPYTLQVNDTPAPADGAQLIGWYMPTTGTRYANLADGWDNNFDEFHIAASTAQRIVTPAAGGNNIGYVYLYMRYPRSLLVTNPLTGAKSYRITNKIGATLIGDYGAKDYKEGNGSYTYSEVIWEPKPGVTLSKSARGDAPGMIDRLEKAWDAGKTDPLVFHPGSTFTWSVGSTREDWARTKDAQGNYGALPWTAVHLDNQFSFDTNLTTSTSYYQLQAGDYALTRLTLSQPNERIYGEPNQQGLNTLIPQDPTKYGQVTVQVATVTNPAEGDWITIGISRLNPALNTGWTYTPTTGAPVSMLNNYTYIVDLQAALPGTDVLGVRMLQTTTAASVTQSYSMLMTINPSARVMTGLKSPPARTAARNTVNLYNMAYNWARGGNTEESNPNSITRSMYLNRQTYSSTHTKSVGSSNVDFNARQVTLPFTLHAYNSSPFPAGTTRADAISLDLLQEQTEGIFYDLLPLGTSVNLATVEAYGYQGGSISTTYRASHSVEIIDNFRNTGRSLMIVRVTMPETTENFYLYPTTPPSLQTGFSVRFTLVNTFDNLLDNPKSGRNYSAYESTVGRLGAGRTDTPGTFGFTEPAAQTAFTNVNNRAEPDDFRFMQAYADWAVNPPLATQLGFDKLVKTPEDKAWSKETVVQGGGIYNYRLRLANYPDTSARNIIFYDSLEDRAPEGVNYWQGRLVGIDLSHPRLTWGLEPVVYYATRRVEPKNDVNDRLIVNDQLNTALWKPLDINNIPADLVSIAVDMRYKPDGSAFVLPPERSLIVMMSMRSPGDVTPYVNPTDYAWNSAYLGAQTERGGIVSANAVVDVTPTKVSLRPVDLTISKTASPVTGTQALPTVVYENAAITYTIGTKNINGAEAIPGVVLEDTIPAGLLINTANIRFRFGLGAFQLLSATTRVKLVQTGQKLSFEIDQLAAGESVDFQIPTTVKKPTEQGPIRHENTAVITQAFGYSQNIQSPTTYHETPAASVPILVNKLLNGGTLGRVPKAGEFAVHLLNASRQVIGTYTNKGEAPYAFDIPDQYFGVPGTYTYYLREVTPNPPEAGMTYSLVDFQVTVTVAYNAVKREMTAIPTYRLNSATQTPPVAFWNTYKATGSFTPSIDKLLSGMPQPDAFYEDKFRATLTDELGRVQTVTNLEGKFTFPKRDFTELDIGRTFTYTIKEVANGLDSIQYDEREITLKALVVDLGNGKLDVIPTYWVGNTKLERNEAKLINSHINTTFSATKLWVDGDPQDNFPLPDPLPTVYLQLYRDGAAFGDPARLEDPDTVANPGPTTTWSYTWQNLPKMKADNSGDESVYTVLEVVPPKNFQFTQVDNTITNSFRPGVFTARKVWEGLDSLPGENEYTVKIDLYQTVLNDNSGFAKYIETVELTGLASTATTGSREIAPWVYSWEELDASGLDPRPGRTGSVSFEYEIRENAVYLHGTTTSAPFKVDTVTSASTRVVNVYQLTSFTATKVWENGPEGNRPGVAFTLYQGMVDPDNPDNVIKTAIDTYTLPEGTTSHTWSNLDRFDKHGNLYQYSFLETGLVWPEGAQEDTYDARYSEDGLTVINSYVQPKISVSATKIWAGGPVTDRNEADLLELYYYPSGLDPAEARPVLVEPVYDEKTNTHTWSDLLKTTLLGVPYEYFIRVHGQVCDEVVINNNTYVIKREVSETDPYFFTLTNTYQLPTGEVVVIKRWSGGPLSDRIELNIDLYRQTSAMATRELVGADPEYKPGVEDQPNVHSYTWSGLELTDVNGLPYTFTVGEGGMPGIIDVEGNIITVVASDNRYTSTLSGLEVTNTYIVPQDDIVARKIWDGGPVADHTEVRLQLYREVKDSGADPLLMEINPVVTQDEATGDFLYTWAKLPTTTFAGLPYVYTVQEVDAVLTEDGLDLQLTVDSGNLYQVKYDQDQLTVTNTYVPQRDEIRASKLWQGGPKQDHVQVALSLYRKTTAMANREQITSTPVVTSEVEGLFIYAWADLPLFDQKEGLAYTYSVAESGSNESGLFVQNGRNYGVSIVERRVINTYMPAQISVIANKTWQGGPVANHSLAELELSRIAQGMDAPKLLANKPFITGENPYTYTWLGLPDSTQEGLPYTYTVSEAGLVDGKVSLNGSTYEVQKDPVDANALINRYVPPTGDITAGKQWVGGPVSDHKQVALELLRQTTAMDAPEVVATVPQVSSPATSLFDYT